MSPDEQPNMMTPAECLQAIHEELGSWGVSQLSDQGLDDAIWDTEPGYQDLDRAARQSYFDAVREELWG